VTVNQSTGAVSGALAGTDGHSIARSTDYNSMESFSPVHTTAANAHTNPNTHNYKGQQPDTAGGENTSASAIGYGLQTTSVDRQKVGNTTVGKLAKVLTNEIGSLSTPKGRDPKELQNGEAALANTLINNANRAKPNETARDTGTASPQLSKAMREAYMMRANGGFDPVHGRTFYGTSHIPPSRLHSRPIGNSRQTVYKHFGPFYDSWSHRTTWIYIYNNPGH